MMDEELIKEYMEESKKSEGKDKKMSLNPRNSQTQRAVALAVLFFLIGFAISYLMFGVIGNDGSDLTENNDENSALDDEDNEKRTSPVLSGDVDIVVPNQPFGETVLITKASLPSAAWVAIYEDNDGEPGNILGARRVNSGDWSGEVVLLRSTEADSAYYAKILSDDGDGSFNHQLDLPFLNSESGEEIMTTFRTTSGSPR